MSVILLLASLAVSAPPLQVVSAHQAAAPERLARIDQALQTYVDQRKIAGLVALVLKDGRPVYERAMGWRDVESRTAMTPDTLFRIASQSKAIISTAVMAMVEDGKVGLTDPVSRFIPEFAQTTVAQPGPGGRDTVPARRPITIRDLLTHTAGISYGTNDNIAALYEAKGLGPAAGFGFYTADKDEPVCQTMERLATLPFLTQPGERWVYGYNTDVLGCVVERASGQPLDVFVRTRITEPLGMRDTAFFVPTGDRMRLATVYLSGADGLIERAPEGAKGQGHYVDGPRRNFSGGAGLVSTARDYARFLEMIRRGGAIGDVRVLGTRAARLMTTNQSGALRSTDGLGFGYGFETTDRYGANGLDGVGAFGWGGAYGTVYRVDPESGIVMTLMIQMTTNRTDIRTVFPTLVYQAFANERQ